MVDKQKHNKNRITGLLIGSLFFIPVHAEKLMEIEPSISMTMGYSDNIALEEKDKTGSFYSEINPGLRLKREGARVQTYLDYTMQGIYYADADDKQSNQINNQLSSRFSAELIESSLFFDLDANVSQELLDSRKSAAEDNVTGADNLTETYTYNLRPYWKGHWGDWAESRLSYSFNEVIYESGSNSASADNSTGQNVRLALANGKAFRSLFWNLDLSHNTIRYEKRGNTRSNNSLFTLGYRYSPKLNFKSFVGYEEYNQPSENSYGSNVGLGIIWRPSPKTLLDLSVGHRFYGRSFDLSYRQNMRRFTVNLKYAESVTSTRSQIIDNNSLEQAVLFPADNVPSVSDGALPQVEIPINSNNTSLYLSKKLAGDINYVNKKSRYKLDFFYETRDFDSSLNDEKSYGSGLQWELQLGKRMVSSIKLNWQHKELERNSVRSDEWGVSWKLTRRLSREMTGNIFVSQHFKNANVDTDEFEEFRFYVVLTKSF